MAEANLLPLLYKTFVGVRLILLQLWWPVQQLHLSLILALAPSIWVRHAHAVMHYAALWTARSCMISTNIFPATHGPARARCLPPTVIRLYLCSQQRWPLISCRYIYNLHSFYNLISISTGVSHRCSVGLHNNAVLQRENGYKRAQYWVLYQRIMLS